MKKFAVIVAGGVGSRFEDSVPKQFSLLNGKPVIIHTIEAFAKVSNPPEIILVINPNHVDYWESLKESHNFKIPHQVVHGGVTRFESVKNGLRMVSPNSLVAVHDAARPLVSKQIIKKSFKEAGKLGNAVVAVYCKDSLRRDEGLITIAVDRNKFYMVQTPQTFQSDLIKMAYDHPYQIHFTDDASVLESMGEEINLIMGSHENLKLTYPEDSVIAEALLNHRKTK